MVVVTLVCLRGPWPVMLSPTEAVQKIDAEHGTAGQEC